uniref:Uncharacterized protein n=1 Tax=Arundo donax TaxID=35708 RepID=A0A0A9C7P2_ARUDO
MSGFGLCSFPYDLLLPVHKGIWLM